MKRERTTGEAIDQLTPVGAAVNRNHEVFAEGGTCQQIINLISEEVDLTRQR
jgi:hypothetical protein